MRYIILCLISFISPICFSCEEFYGKYYLLNASDITDKDISIELRSSFKFTLSKTIWLVGDKRQFERKMEILDWECNDGAATLHYMRNRIFASLFDESTLYIGENNEVFDFLGGSLLRKEE